MSNWVKRTHLNGLTKDGIAKNAMLNGFWGHAALKKLSIRMKMTDKIRYVTWEGLTFDGSGGKWGTSTTILLEDTLL